MCHDGHSQGARPPGSPLRSPVKLRGKLDYDVSGRSQYSRFVRRSQRIFEALVGFSEGELVFLAVRLGFRPQGDAGRQGIGIGFYCSVRPYICRPSVTNSTVPTSSVRSTVTPPSSPRCSSTAAWGWPKRLSAPTEAELGQPAQCPGPECEFGGGRLASDRRVLLPRGRMPRELAPAGATGSRTT